MNGRYSFAAAAYLLGIYRELKHAELKIMLSLINRTNESGECYPSAATICSDSSINVRTLERTMPGLVEKGHVVVIERHKADGSRDSNLYKIPMLGVPGKLPGRVPGQMPGESIYKEVDKDKVTDGFVPPTIEEVTAYAYEKGMTLDVDHFYVYYEDRDWRNKGGSKMKSWKGTLHTWQKREHKTPTPPNVKTTKRERDYDSE